MESSERVAIVTDVLEMDSSSSSLNPKSGEYIFISHILKRYGESIVDLLPNSHEYCTMEQAEKYGKPLSKFFTFGVNATVMLLNEEDFKDIEFNTKQVERDVQLTASKILLIIKDI